LFEERSLGGFCNGALLAGSFYEDGLPQPTLCFFSSYF